LIKLFKKQDQSCNGVLNRHYLSKLLQSLSLGLENAQINDLVSNLDPFQTEKITFSQIVSLLTHKKLDTAAPLLGKVKESMHGRSSAELGLD
jgi:Ca2+-binding EF-hand superfamily protein